MSEGDEEAARRIAVEEVTRFASEERPAFGQRDWGVVLAIAAKCIAHGREQGEAEVTRLREALAEALDTEMDGEPLDPEWCERQRALLSNDEGHDQG